MGDLGKSVHSCLAVIMKCFALFALASVALARPADEAAAVAPLVYGAPYGALSYGALPYAAPAGYALPYAAPHVYNALDTGLVYPVAEAYVHDAAGDVAVDASPAAEAYVHDAAGDVSDNSSPEAEAYIHDTTGDA